MDHINTKVKFASLPSKFIQFEISIYGQSVYISHNVFTDRRLQRSTSFLKDVISVACPVI